MMFCTKNNSICSGCYRKGLQVVSVKNYTLSLESDVNFSDLSFKCCSQDCAQKIESKTYYKTLIKFASQIPKFNQKWNRAQRIYDLFIEENLSKDNFTLHHIAIEELLQKIRICPIHYEYADFIIFPILHMLAGEFKEAYFMLKNYLCFHTQTKKTQIKMKTNSDLEDLDENFLKILDDKYYHGTFLDMVKHEENWKCVVAILLARLKIFLIEEMESNLTLKNSFFNLNHINLKFENNPRIKTILTLYIMGTTDQKLRQRLKTQEKQLSHILDLMKKGTFGCKKKCDVEINTCEYRKICQIHQTLLSSGISDIIFFCPINFTHSKFDVDHSNTGISVLFIYAKV